MSTLPLPCRPRPRKVRAFASPRLRGLAQETWSSFLESCGRRTLVTSMAGVARQGASSLSQRVLRWSPSPLPSTTTVVHLRP
eukprot:3031402-Pleurochrysis_carterae.AAC.1